MMAEAITVVHPMIVIDGSRGVVPVISMLVLEREKSLVAAE